MRIRRQGKGPGSRERVLCAGREIWRRRKGSEKQGRGGGRVTRPSTDAACEGGRGERENAPVRAPSPLLPSRLVSFPFLSSPHFPLPPVSSLLSSSSFPLSQSYNFPSSEVIYVSANFSLSFSSCFLNLPRFLSALLCYLRRVDNERSLYLGYYHRERVRACRAACV